MSKIYQKLFAKFYDAFMQSFEKRIEKDRHQMLNSLEGQVLDVGSGTGVNFQYFNHEVHVLAVEPSAEMLKKSIPKINNKHIELLNVGVNDEVLDEKIKEKSLDAIVCTLVLCTIPEPELALKNFKKWLKPSGKLVVLEHVHSDKKVNQFFENTFNPFWNKFADGCNLNRNTHELLLANDFTTNESSFFHIGLRIHKGEYRLK